MRHLLTVAAALLLAIAVACGGDDDATTPTATPASNSDTATATQSVASTREFSSENFAFGVSITADSTWSVEADVSDDFAIERAGDTQIPTGYVEVALPTAVDSVDGLSVEPLPADFAAWLTNHPRLIQRGKRDVTIGGLEGVQIDVASDLDSEFKLFELADGTFEVGYSDRIRFYVLSGSDGPIVLAVFAERAAAFDRFSPLADPIIESIQFTESPTQ